MIYWQVTSFQAVILPTQYSTMSAYSALWQQTSPYQYHTYRYTCASSTQWQSKHLYSLQTLHLGTNFIIMIIETAFYKNVNMNFFNISNVPEIMDLALF